MPAAEWVAEFLDRRHLANPDGRPLYGYRCTAAEFEQIGTLCRGIPFNQAANRCVGSTSAVFCLFAAEWWKRHHDGGPWRWHEILTLVDWPYRGLTPPLYEAVENGLSFWKRHVLRVGSDSGFLVTLACEGGLPLRLVEEETNLRTYFHHLLKEFHIFGPSGVPARDLAERVAHHLPRSFRQPIVYELGGELIEQIWSLQAKVEGTDDPVAELDRIEPSWRDNLPLVIEDPTATLLLTNLVVDASRMARRRTSGIALLRMLSLRDDAWQLHAELRAPSRLPEETLLSALGTPPQGLPSRLQLLANFGTGTGSLYAQAMRISRTDPIQYLVETYQARGEAVGPLATEEVRLEVRARDDRLGELPVAGAAALGDAPWVFVPNANDSRTLDFVGEGSVRTRYPNAFVAVPPGWQVAEQTDSLTGTAIVADFGRPLVPISGTATITSGDDVCIIRCAQQQDEIVSYRLSGEQRPWGPEGAPVLVGPPRLVELPADGVPRTLRLDDMSWRLSNGPPARWAPLSHDCVGEVQLRYVAGGELRFRSQAAILPSEAEVSLEPGRTGKDGALVLSHARRPEVGIEPIDGVTCSVTTDPRTDRVTINLNATGQVPAVVTLYLRWSDHASLRLILPYPTRAVRFVDAQGTALAANRPVSIDRLAGLRAVAIDNDPNAAFAVEARLFADDVDAETANRFVRRYRLHQVTAGRYDLELRTLERDLRASLAGSSDLDATVRLKVESDGRPIAGRDTFVGRFDWRIERDEVAGTIKLVDANMRRPSPEHLANARLITQRLDEPEAEPVTLSPCGEDQWSFAPETRAAAPWLITAWEGWAPRARPTLWVVPPSAERDGDEHAADPLSEAIRCPDPIARYDAIDSCLRMLATDSDSPLWARLLAYMDAFRDLPAPTLDVIARLAHNHSAAAMTLLKARREQFDRVWSTLAQLPFSWSCLPLSAWLEAARCMIEPLRPTNIFRELAPRLFDTFREYGPARRAPLSVVVELIEVEVLELPVNPDGMLARALDPNRKIELLRSFDRIQGELARRESWPPGPSAREHQAQIREIPLELDSLWRRPPTGLGYRDPLLNAPIAAAMGMAFGHEFAAIHLFDLHRLRDIDPDLFDEAQTITLAIAGAWRLQQFPEKRT